ncbi:hypothetical protein ACGFIW_01140 [Micromonospora sp. NPDC048935]|uniref:hypothetical protein n=1 Tax=Micromonospora sp. NPDC048935 TaxID=3364262 RepID=UPI0037168232
MRKPTQHRRRRRRLLLLAGLGTGAGLGIALALGSPAHADDQPNTDTIHEIVDTPGQILNNQPATDDQPQSGRELINQALADTAAAIGDITRAPAALPHLPEAGRVVDEVTDTAVEAVTPPESQAATPVEPAAAVTPAITPDVAPAANTTTPGGTQTAPEPAPVGPPVPGGTGSGAPTIAVQHPDAHTATPPAPAAVPPGRSQVVQREHVQPGDAAPTTQRGPRISPGDDHADHRPAVSLRTLDHTAGPGRTPAPPRWEHPHTGHHSTHHDGRTQPPSPPPG